jgi:hypothetical protein
MPKPVKQLADEWLASNIEIELDSLSNSRYIPVARRALR